MTVDAVSETQQMIIPASNVDNKMGLIADVICLMLDSVVYLPDTLYDIKKNLVGAIFKDQALIMIQDSKVVAYVSWAFLSPEVEKKYIKNSNSLDVMDWNSGDNLWLVDVVSPYGDTVQLLNYTKHLAKAIGYKGKTIKFKSYKTADNFQIREVKL